MKAGLPAPSGLPAALALQPGEALPVNHQLSLCHDGEILYYFLGIAPIACHHRDDKRARNLCLARCALFQLASLVDLARPFGLSPRTILRARQTLERDGEMGFAPRQRTRRRHAIQDPEVLERAARLLADGASLRHTARQLALCFETLRTYQRRGLLPPVPPDPASAATEAPPVAAKPCSPPTATAVRSTPPVRPPQQAAGTDSPPPLDRVQRDHRDAQARQGRATHDTPGRLNGIRIVFWLGYERPIESCNPLLSNHLRKSEKICRKCLTLQVHLCDGKSGAVPPWLRSTLSLRTSRPPPSAVGASPAANSPRSRTSSAPSRP